MKVSARVGRGRSVSNLARAEIVYKYHFGFFNNFGLAIGPTKVQFLHYDLDSGISSETWKIATRETRMMTPVSICSSRDPPVVHIELAFLKIFFIMIGLSYQAEGYTFGKTLERLPLILQNL